MLGCGSRRFGSPIEQDHRNLVSWPRCPHREGDTRRATTEPPVPLDIWRVCRDTSGHEEDPAQQVRHLRPPGRGGSVQVRAITSALRCPALKAITAMPLACAHSLMSR